ncbi:enamine deaminase RidA (YjgF/YER057c/UK114 family) [Murinocardiopsis flavida]|uniref:Enamine deaminase RidA (YjgF/YER057c/UK114 family) n=1 Tax=Murinocardiopsis flavida TaxID=645275 RepID=A0A2P8DMU1_9ACTN|nr:RidA family protein [Murinocardiopsis flavida]PSK98527.1 enamine deaminase RidA (YjgF/YER057c/UK114 family) [Murinocardiopsis flavida]
MTTANPRITSSSPADLHATGGYHHVTLVSAGRTAHLAGQCPLDADEKIVALGDPLGQADRTAENALVALTSAGARPEDVIRTVVYVASDDPDVLAEVWHRLAEDSPIKAAFVTASTLIGVTCLGYRGQLVEVDLTAALPEG